MCKKCILAVLVIFFQLFLSCSSDKNLYTIETINGVKHIHNNEPQWGNDPAVSLEFVQQIGVLDSEDQNYLLHRPQDIVIDQPGNMYIIDSGNYRIQVYDRSGLYLRTIGRKGLGPGEIPNFMRCADIFNNTLYVVHTNRFVDKFSCDGHVLGRFSGDIVINRLRHFSTREFIQNCRTGYYGNSSFNRSDISLILVFSESGIVREFGSPIFFEDQVETLSANHILAEIDKEDNVYATFCTQNRLDKYSYSGEHLFSSDRPLNYNVAEKPEWVDPGPSRKVSSVPEFTHVSNNISIDNRSRIWVTTPNIKLSTVNPDEELFTTGKSIYDFHIFDSEGIFLGTLPVPVKWTEFKMRIFEDRLFLIEEKNEMCVYEYKIIDY